jgi:hypothetical protein
LANHVTIERVGGLAGFGAPASRVRSHGRVDLDRLSADDRAAVEALFSRYRATSPTPRPDAFRYKISRGSGASAEAIEVPEEALPSAVTGAVKDELI